MQYGTLLTERKELRKEFLRRNKAFVTKSVPLPELQAHLDSGWRQHGKPKKTTCVVSKEKSHGEQFEDAMWVMLYRMGFSMLSSGRKFKLSYSHKGEQLTQQIDVYAEDDETILIVECKSAVNEGTASNFKKEIESFGGIKEGLIGNIKRDSAKRGKKIKLVFATNRYVLADPDVNRLDNYDIHHITEVGERYYTSLAQELAIGAKYQFLASVFPGQTIPELPNVVPAIRGMMGGYEYYTFSVEPRILLSLAFVLHQNSANDDLMPTYQRLIKKSRLNQIRGFVEEGGYFPNSIIVSIEADKVQFDLAEKRQQDSSATLGHLHLPRKYRSIYVIDGQHRLYGYAETEARENAVIPVVAFVNLPREEQIRLFMEINENQKSVPKNLRLTLEADLLWTSDRKDHQMKAVVTRASKYLAEKPTSALFGRVIVGEDAGSVVKCITLASIRSSIWDLRFVNEYDVKNRLVGDGILDTGDKDDTCQRLFDFLSGCFGHYAKECPDEWAVGEGGSGCLSTNGGVYANIRFFQDLLEHGLRKHSMSGKTTAVKKLVDMVHLEMKPIYEFYRKMDAEQKRKLKTLYGFKGWRDYWRVLQQEKSRTDASFKPEGLAKYLEDRAKVYNKDGMWMIGEIEKHLNHDFKRRLTGKYGGNWQLKGVPKRVLTNIAELALDKSVEEGKEVDRWTCLMFIHYQEIAIQSGNWAELFEKRYSRDEPNATGRKKEDKTSWVVKVNDLRKKLYHHDFAITKEEFDYLKQIRDWVTRPADPEDV